jgi:hypothetical protein
MTKKKAKRKITKKKAAKMNTPKMPRTRKQASPSEVRNDIAKIVGFGAMKITRAVMSQAMTGQLAPAKYLFEVAGVYPPMTDGSHATADEDCLAKTLLRRLDIPDKPIVLDEEDGPEIFGEAAAVEEAGSANEEYSKQESLDPEMVGRVGKVVPALV